MKLTFETWLIERCVEYARNPRKNDHTVDKVAVGQTFAELSAENGAA